MIAAIVLSVCAAQDAAVPAVAPPLPVGTESAGAPAAGEDPPGGETPGPEGSAPTAIPAGPVEILLEHPGQQTGDLERIAQDWWRALSQEPRGPFALDFLDGLAELVRFDGSLVDGEDLVQLLPRLGAGAPRDRARGMLQALVVRRMFSTQPLELPAGLYGDFIGNWELLGPLGPLDHPAPYWMEIDQLVPSGGARSGFVTDWGEAIDWIPVTRSRGERGVVPGREIWPALGASFLRARLTLPDERAAEAVLEVDADGPFEAWWNGVAIGGRSAAGSLREPGPLRVGVTFESGAWSTLLLRVPTAGGEVRARCFDSEGEVLGVFSWSPDGGALLEYESAAEPAGQLRFPAPRVLPNHELAGALAVRRAVQGGRPDRALALGIEGEATDRQRAAWLRERHSAAARASHLPAEVQRRMLMELEQVLDASGVSGALGVLGEFSRIQRLLSEDQPAAALDAAMAFEAATAGSAHPLTRLPRISALFALDSTGALGLQALEALVESHPQSSDALLSLARRREVAGDLTGALQLAWRSVVQNGGDAAARSLVLELLGKKPGDPRRTAILDVARRWREQRPTSGTARAFERAALVAVGADEALLENLREQAARRPGRPSGWRQLAEHHLERGQFDGARAALSRMLELVPGDPWAREAAGNLGIEDPAKVFFQAFAPEAREALVEAREASDASTAEALDGGMIYLYPDGSRAQRTHTLTVALDRKGTEELHEREVIGTPLVARVLQVGGGEDEPVQVAGKWVMPNLDPGDAVEVVFDTRAGGLPGRVPNLGRWSFMSKEKPFLRSTYTVFVPDGLGGELRTGHFDGSREARRVAGGTVHVLRASDRPRVAEEVFMPSYAEILPWAAFGKDIELRRLVEEWRGNLADLMAAPADMDAELRELVASREWPEALAPRAKALWAVLEERTLDFAGSALPTSVWYLRRGNPILLYALLLESAGVPYEFALLEDAVSPALDPEPVEPFAYVGGLERPALRIGGPGNPALWQVMPARRGESFGLVPGQLAGVSAVVLEATGAGSLGGGAGFRQESLPSSGLEGEWSLDLASTWKLQEDGSAEVTGSIAITTVQGDGLLEQLRRATANQREGYVRQLVGGTLGGLDLGTWSLPGLEPGAGPERGTRVLFSGTLPGAVQTSGDESTVNLRLPGGGLSTALGPAQRRWPLALRVGDRQRVSLRIEPGEHWTLPAAPDGFEARQDGFEHSLTAALDDGGALDLRRVVALRGLLLAPDQVPGFLDREAELEREESRPLPISRTAGER